MKIAEVAEAEREAPQGLFEVTFEVIEPFDFHEKIVAVSALGSLVRSFRSSIAAVPLVETRRNEAKLAMTINALKHTEGEEKVDVSMDMQDKDLDALARGLLDFVRTNDQDITTFSNAGNLIACAARQTETIIAEDMLGVLSDSGFSPVQDIMRNPVGYTRQ